LSEKPCGAYFFAFFENFFVPILTSGGYISYYATSLSACVSLLILAIFAKKKVMPIKIIEKRDVVNIGVAAVVCFF